MTLFYFTHQNFQSIGQDKYGWYFKTNNKYKSNIELIIIELVVIKYNKY